MTRSMTIALAALAGLALASQAHAGEDRPTWRGEQPFPLTAIVTNKFDDRFDTSPTIVDDTIYLCSHKSLYNIAKK